MVLILEPSALNSDCNVDMLFWRDTCTYNNKQKNKDDWLVTNC